MFFAQPLRVTTHDSLREAIVQQLVIGLEFLPHGLLSRQWAVALDKTGMSHADSKLATLIRFIWTDFVQPLWSLQNDILHHQQNHAHSLEADMLGDHIQWYVNNGHGVLSCQDQFLACFSHQDIVGMTRPVRR